MCGRFTQKSEKPEIELEFSVDTFLYEPAASYNIAPAQKAGIIAISDGISFSMLSWGIKSPWPGKPPLINARAETILEKKTFIPLVQSCRCLVPCSGYYEWRKTVSGKTPFFIYQEAAPLFALAGIYSPQSCDQQSTFCIITAKACPELNFIHERMPLVINKSDYQKWLTGNFTTLLFPPKSCAFSMYEVSSMVNNPACNNPLCIQRVN
ncbi:MAG TPA: hypothetical protein DC049_01605 [Spirochaetia bacterium]|nr:hypothetical protein [Spirochaetia bacterium]